MKLLRNIFIGIFLFIALLLITALFVKKTYTVEKQITIAKPSTDVFSYVRLLKNQQYYSRWAGVDPQMKISYKGVDGTIGFISKWHSKNNSVGTGEQEIKFIEDGKKIDYIIRFIWPVQTEAKVYMITDSLAANTTSVKWGYEGKVAYPFNITLLFMDIEESIGKDFDTGLGMLKKILESQP